MTRWRRYSGPVCWSDVGSAVNSEFEDVSTWQSTGNLTVLVMAPTSHLKSKMLSRLYNKLALTALLVAKVLLIMP